jgi:signal transduction histidine kinase
MHPILRDNLRLGIYVAAWLLVGVLVGLVVAGPRLEEWRTALLLCIPMADLYGFICLAVWYPCRSNPLAESSPGRLLAVHGSGALVSTALWLALGWIWSLILDRTGLATNAVETFLGALFLFLAVGILLYVVAVVLHYLLLAFEASSRAESEALEARLLARQAELDAFKAQIDPHFLFNCLNSISSLCGSDPQAARRTAIRLGDFLRSSLELGSRDTIPLAAELDLARAYLEVEKARFGDRLVLEEAIDEASLSVRVPALMLQPLLENALKHGIAHLLTPGRVVLASRATASRLTLEVSNTCDSARPSGSGAGIGLANIRGRLRLLYGDVAYMTAREEGDRFTVEIVLPIEEPRELTRTQDEEHAHGSR